MNADSLPGHVQSHNIENSARAQYHDVHDIEITKSSQTLLLVTLHENIAREHQSRSLHQLSN